MFGIGNCRFQYLFDNDSSFFWCESQNIKRLINFFATNQIGNQTTFLR